MSFHILWEDNVYEIIWWYFKNWILKLQVQWALHNVTKGMSKVTKPPATPMGIVQGSETWPYYQMVYTQTRISPGEWDP